MHNHAKGRMLRGEPAFGLGLGSGSPVIAETLSHSGADWVMLDLQHGSWDPASTIHALMGIATGTATPFVRVLKNDFAMIGRALDEGALGIIVPNVDTAADANAAAQAARFPPAGLRSWGWGRARAYGADYGYRINEELLLTVQIESAVAVDNAEAIMATPGVDGCFVGPADLLVSMGGSPREPEAHAEQLERSIERIFAACRNTGKIAGISCPTPAEAQRRVDQGCLLVTTGYDVLMAAGQATANLEQVGRAGSLKPAGGY